MMVERIHPKAPVIFISIAIFTCLPSCINLSNIDPIGSIFVKESIGAPILSVTP